MKIYQVNTSTGHISWHGTEKKAEDYIAMMRSKITEPFDAEYTAVEVPLLKPDFLEWLNHMFGGYQNV